MLGPIRIAAALIDDGQGRILLVRKRGTALFMQAGGKIDAGETPFEALVRELTEELCFAPTPDEAHWLGDFTAIAANEPGRMLEAQLFHVRAHGRTFVPAAELDEVIWIPIADAALLPLAPLTRDQVLPLARMLAQPCGARDIRE
jgi:8-oxo-dGTP pyrophosphatase MutT (NUDIX family)